MKTIYVLVTKTTVKALSVTSVYVCETPFMSHKEALHMASVLDRSDESDLLWEYIIQKYEIPE